MPVAVGAAVPRRRPCSRSAMRCAERDEAHRKFTADDFAVFHPAGQIGRKLIRVREAMTFRMGENLPVASDALGVGEVLHEVSTLKRRAAR